MSIVKMDMTEYEALKKNEALLEQLVAEKERLVGELEQSREDVKEAMKANERTVTIIMRTDKYNHKKTLRPSQEIMDRLAALFGVNPIRVRDLSYRFGSSDVDSVMSNIAESFFGEWTSESLPTEESISRVGFDEAKAEVQAQYKRELTASTNEKLSQLANLTVEFDKLKKQLAPIEQANRQLTSVNNDLSNKVKSLEENNSKLSTSNTGLISILSDIKTNAEGNTHSGMFENKKRIKAIVSILKTLEDE